ncbi:valine--tRNA ligase [Buchnera aphidicola]|uniref:Valine--tRNA ligase n=1 Tax=Buchnera aphidicola (Cinara strobi) TaxID=1921549 RepID=A0A3B1E9I5_9GAMM|nr:valine--tRNA ligase [Buchnera aphidicola]VAX76609.1 Valine--tRNA ligase [Buchnera aphidicola (Cinara strobi)]
MEKNYNFKVIEKIIHRNLEKNKFFFNQNDYLNRENFCIMVPPPNITGYLHMGHAFQQTIMDVIIRYNSMIGKNTLLQMGTDHAGIATQMVVERYLFNKEGKIKNEYTRKEFIKKIFSWKKQSESIMFNQIKKLGHLIDWKSVRFTLDSEFSIAVNRVFISLYKEGLVYRRKKLVHWDPKLQTVISDLEVDNRICKQTMWYIKYLILNNNNHIFNKKYLVVATTRPETLLGDTALAVHPSDNRYTKYIGSFVKVPLINRVIPIISDSSIDISKGTGCVKITPAHDFNDYAIGLRHKLLMINIFTKDGKILNKLNIFNYNGKIIKTIDNRVPENLKNQDRFVARKKILFFLKKNNYLKKFISYKIRVPYGDRSGVVLEPMLTNQWYLSMKQLSILAIKAVKTEKIVFVPKQYKNMYLSWMNNIQDWCISRQLWWGHRIPVWYDSQNNVYVGENEKLIRKEYVLSQDIILYRDPDVLDTWFSSSLWTFAGLGWPKNTKKISIFHPTDVLVCGFDIIFFWISRMIMMTMHIIKDKHGSPQIPFKTVYVTGLIRDEEGKKMSKSHGNVLDPLDMIHGISLSKLIKKRTKNLINSNMIDFITSNTIKSFPKGISAHSTDALRYTFLSLASTSRNIHWDMNRLQGYQNFCNKIWHASCFIIKHIKKNNMKQVFFNSFLLNEWILLELNNIIKKYHHYFHLFRFDSISQLLYQFVWNKFCDQYLEIIKPILKNGSDYEKKVIKNTLLYLIKTILILLHPIMPFITTYLWDIFQKKNQTQLNSIILLNPIPKYNVYFNNINIIKFMNWFQKMILVFRNIRSDFKVKHTKLLKVYLKNLSYKIRIFLQENYSLLKKVAYLKFMIEIQEFKIPSPYIIRIIDNIEIFILVDSFLDVNLELQRLNKKIILLKNQINNIKNLLLNKNFLVGAPSHVIKEKKFLLKDNIRFLKKINNQKTVLLKKI